LYGNIGEATFESPVFLTAVVMLEDERPKGVLLAPPQVKCTFLGYHLFSCDAAVYC